MSEITRNNTGRTYVNLHELPAPKMQVFGEGSVSIAIAPGVFAYFESRADVRHWLAVAGAVLDETLENAPAEKEAVA